MSNSPENEARLSQSRLDALKPELVEPMLGEISPNQVTHLRTFTPARIGLRRTGISLNTAELLDFQLAHGRARDAVHASLQPASLLADLRSALQPQSESQPSHEAILLHSAAANRHIYLQRPDLGRRLDDASRQRLAQHRDSPSYDLQIVVADGLSALAVERHAVPLLVELISAIAEHCPRLHLAPICVVEQGRVAVGDEVAHAFSASLVVVLIGERPGLSSPDSLGAYITWQPQPGQTTDAERNCISNIRTEGLSYHQAAARLLFYIQQATTRRVTGVALKDPDEFKAQLRSGEPV